MDEIRTFRTRRDVLATYLEILEGTHPRVRWQTMQVLHVESRQWPFRLTVDDLVFLKVNRIAP